MAEESSSGGEKTEAPSSKRRTDFRKKGQVAQSKEVQTAALFTLVLLFWMFYMPNFWNSLSEILAAMWRNIDTFDGTPSTVTSLSIYVVKDMAILLSPLFGLVMVIGFFSSVFQIGWLFTTKPLTPDFSKISMIKGFGRMFSMKSIVDLVKSVLKIVLIAYIAYSTVFDHFEEALILVDTSVTDTIFYMARIATLIMGKVCSILILIAAIDFLYTRYEMEEKMKMTKQEVKLELRDTIGS
ncbi:MAG: EscU/YscU/HrcU family type III secretion system export apparatus switch protein, partial [Desulfocapsa sp.]|nr:EscU/YscU/HrcU family type III secretion system export apparatus switch protein [Desulfocapsa sp.]